MTKDKIFALLVLFILAQGCYVKNRLIIPPKKHVSIYLEESLPANVLIKNKGVGELAVSVNYNKNQRQISGFGLDGRATGKILIKKNCVLQFKNGNDFKKVVHFRLEDVYKTKEQVALREINLKLINNSSTSIPLIIPDVMSPTLSPNSTSNVRLKIGQEIIFKKNMNKSVIYTVSEKNEDGDKIYINELINKTE